MFARLHVTRSKIIACERGYLAGAGSGYPRPTDTACDGQRKDAEKNNRLVVRRVGRLRLRREGVRAYVWIMIQIGVRWQWIEKRGRCLMNRANLTKNCSAKRRRRRRR